MSFLLGGGLTAYGAGVVAGLSPTTPPRTVDAGSVPPVFFLPVTVPPVSVPPVSVPARGPAGDRTSGLGISPVELAIPALQVRAWVLPVGTRADGSLQVPPSARDLGWWRGSAAPGSPSGTVVIAGHVDTAQEGPGALFRLAEIPVGSRIHVRSRDGTTRTYRVAARRSYPKRNLPATVFAGSGSPRLVLITCGGTFDEHTRSYSDNIVAYATAG